MIVTVYVVISQFQIKYLIFKGKSIANDKMKTKYDENVLRSLTSVQAL